MDNKIKLANRSRRNRVFFDDFIREMAICLNVGEAALNREQLFPTYVNHAQADLTDSHAKVYLSQGKTKSIALITSANATNNYRNECYYGTDRPTELEQITRDIRGILASSDRITG